MINGQDVEVFKEPVTDTGKKSKRGRLTLQMEEGVYRTFEKGTGDPDKVFRKGGRKEGKDGGRKKWEYGLDVIFFSSFFFNSSWMMCVGRREGRWDMEMKTIDLHVL